MNRECTLLPLFNYRRVYARVIVFVLANHNYQRTNRSFCFFLKVVPLERQQASRKPVWRARKLRISESPRKSNVAECGHKDVAFPRSVSRLALFSTKILNSEPSRREY